MKKIYYFIIALLLFCTSSLQAQTTEGKEFWIAFGKVANIPLQSSYMYSLNMDIRIICGSEAADVTIYFTNSGKSVHYSMYPYEIYNYVFEYDDKYATYHDVTGKTDKSVRVTASNPVSVFAYRQYIGVANDVTNILPVTALGTEYYAISYPAPNSYYINIFDAYAVVATQDSTIIYHDGVEQITLHSGDVYYKTAPLFADITGTHITATHPVAFFAQCQLTIIPTGVIINGVGDILFQQLAPVHTWGRTFFVPVSVIQLEYVRIVVAQDNTTITQTGGTIRTQGGGKEALENLQAGQFVELVISQDNKGCFIEANNPVGVCSFMRTPPHYLNDIGSSSQVWIPAMEQSTPIVLMAPFEDPIYHYHYALVITPTNDKDITTVSIGGAPKDSLSGGVWYNHTEMETSMSFYNFPLTDHTAYYIFSNPAGVIVLGYGLNIAGTMASSYYYLAGSAMRELDAAFYANDVHFQNLEKTPFCENLVTFRAELDNMGVEMDSIKWYVNGVKENLPHDQLVWSKTFNEVREYEIRMWVRFENDTVSKTGILKIENCNFSTAFYANNVHYENLSDTVFCNKTVNFITYIENLNTVQDSIKWYIDFGDGFEEYEAARNKKQWSRDFETGSYEIIMEAHLANGETLPPLVATLKMEVLWIKMRNVRY